MAFHVEISAGLNRARAFNLDEAEVRRLVERWVSDLTIELGDREWQPRKSSIKILEGPALEPPELSFGQGWSNAERSSKAVTRELVSATAEEAETGATSVIVVGAAEAAEKTVAEIGIDAEASRISWREARRWIDDRDPEVAAVILVTELPEATPRTESPPREE
jgi:hypothetical protein